MKLLNHIQSLLRGTIMLIVPAVAGLTACNGIIYDDLDPCPEGLRLRFVYDYNMEFANAFPSQVDCLTVLVYNEDGTYHGTYTVTDRNKLADESWRLDIDLPAGKYKVIAYGGLQCDDSSFHFVDTPAAGSQLSSLQVALDADIMNKPTGTDLHKLFWGTPLSKSSQTEITDFSKAIDVTVKGETPEYDEYTVYMMRDTNNVRVILAHAKNNKPVNAEDFKFTLVDDNTLMGWNNDIIPTTDYTYLPFSYGPNDAVNSDDSNDNDEQGNIAIAEFSIGRLLTSNSPDLKVTRVSDGGNVIDIPLTKYLAYTMSASLNMSLQEYFDRENQWNLTFILDDNNLTWSQVNIEVQDWVVRINNPELKR